MEISLISKMPAKFGFIGYFLFVIPGVIMHLICIFAAASGDPYK